MQSNYTIVICYICNLYSILSFYILGEKAYIDWLKANTNKAWGWGFIVGLILFYVLPLCFRSFHVPQ